MPIWRGRPWSSARRYPILRLVETRLPSPPASRGNRNDAAARVRVLAADAIFVPDTKD